MANKYNLTGKVVFTSEEAMTLPKSATAPASPVSGDMYYNTTTNEVQIYKDGSWQDVAVGTVSLTDQPLNENEIIVGNASNLSDNVDTDAVGDIRASSDQGLVVKDGVIDDANIATNAAIARSKIASGTANRLVKNDGTGALAELDAITASRALVSDVSGLPVASTVTDTELGYVSGVTSSIQAQLDDKASIALDNLANTAVNDDILPATNDTVDLGSIEKNFRNIHSIGFLLGESASGPTEPEAALYLDPTETILTSEKILSIKTKDNGAGDSEDINIATGTATGTRGDVRIEAGAAIIDTSFGAVLQNPSADVSAKLSVGHYTLTASTSSFTVISTDLNVTRSVFKSGEVHYEIVDSVTDEVRKGKIDFAAGPSSAGFSDAFTSSNAALDTAIEFDVTVNAGVVEFKYKNTSSNNCSFRVIRTVMSSGVV